MIVSGRAGVALPVALALVVGLAGCASSGVATRSIAETENITPIQNTPVATAALPPIGADGQVQSQDPLLVGGDTQAGVSGSVRRIHRPTATTTALRKNGIRHPQARS